MYEAIHDVTSRGIQDYATKPRHEWVLDWPGMVVLVVTAIYWTRGEQQTGQPVVGQGRGTGKGGGARQGCGAGLGGDRIKQGSEVRDAGQNRGTGEVWWRQRRRQVRGMHRGQGMQLLSAAWKAGAWMHFPCCVCQV